MWVLGFFCGFSNPRNSVLMKMFNLLDIGERAGSGIPNIYSVWQAQKWAQPHIEERLDSIERTILSLPIVKVPIKSADKPNKTITAIQKASIIELVNENITIKSIDLQVPLNIGDTRAKALLRELVSDGVLTAEGGNRNRTYRINPNHEK